MTTNICLLTWNGFIGKYEIQHMFYHKTNKMADALSRTILPQNDQDKVFPHIDDMYHIDNKTINRSIN